MLKDWLSANGFSGERIESAISGFSPEQTVSEYYQISSNEHIIKALAFGSYKIFASLLRESKANPEVVKSRKVTVPVTGTYIISLIKSMDSLLLEFPRDEFLRALKTYKTPVEEADLEGPRKSVALSAIRR